MNQLWGIYHNDIPDFLHRFAAVPPMERLKEVGMNCGCEYTRFPLFADIGSYSRYDHSMGVALIVWHFTGSREQTLAALFHDVTTPAFAHVVDFLNGDHLRQESTEAGVAECLAASPEVCALLAECGVALDDISDYHRYPVADNDVPALSADRLEYTLGNLFNYGFASLLQLQELYEDLMVGTDEAGQQELTFRTPEKAAEFARLAMKTARVYVADEDRFAMEALAQLLRKAMARGVLTYADLGGTEPVLIEKLNADVECAAAWNAFCSYSRILRSTEKPKDGFWVQVDAKRRWIDPLAEGHGRVSVWDAAVRADMEVFRVQDFSCWLSAE